MPFVVNCSTGKLKAFHYCQRFDSGPFDQSTAVLIFHCKNILPWKIVPFRILRVSTFLENGVEFHSDVNRNSHENLKFISFYTKHMQYKHPSKYVFLIPLWHWNPISVWEVKYLLGCTFYPIFRIPVYVWNVYKCFPNSIKIWSLNMDWSSCCLP